MDIFHNACSTCNASLYNNHLEQLILAFPKHILKFRVCLDFNTLSKEKGAYCNQEGSPTPSESDLEEVNDHTELVSKIGETSKAGVSSKASSIRLCS